MLNGISRYVKDILKNTSRSVDQVTIQPQGQWELHSKPDKVSQPNGVASDEDDDLVEITKTGDSVTMGTPRAWGTPVGGNPLSSREHSSSSVAPRSAGSTSSKRPIAAIIDLTSSGDEDEEPIARAPKRQFSSYNPTAAPVYRPAPNGYHPRD